MPGILRQTWGQAAPATTPPNTLSTQPLVVARATDVIGQWTAHQHLYLKGDLGVSQDQLDSLEAWLDQNAPNWTVVLTESAAGEQYTNSEGRTLVGLDAVDETLGKGLPNRTSFSQQIDPRTKEPNGAFFVLYLRDRKFSYFASDAQDRRGLGEDHWQGRLDQPAISAMRGGSRIVDAVKDTITNINRQLEQKITAEIASRERRVAEEQAERSRALARAKANLQTAADAYVLLERKVNDLNRSHPGLSGDLARPDLKPLRTELDLAQSSLTAGDFTRVAAASTKVRDQSEALIRLIEDYASAPDKLDGLARKIDEQSRRERAPSAAQQLGSAREALAKSRQEYNRGDSSYGAHMQTAQVALASAESAITAALRNAAKVQRLTAFSGLMALIGLSGLGWGLNRRRLKSKNECLELLKIWESGLGEKNLALFGLLDQTSTVVGASSDEATQRYSGETLRLSQQIIQDVDELFIMSACTGRILRDAQALAHPRAAWQKGFNLFASHRYAAALRLLRDQPIVFRPDEALELVVRGPKTERDTLLGRLESYQPFTMTFTELIEAFNQRASRALSSLELVESSLIHVGTALEATQTVVNKARAQEEELTSHARADGLFRVPLIFDQLLPAAQSAHSEAVRIAIKDPVGALQTFGAQAKQKAEDALALVDSIREFRNGVQPAIGQAVEALRNAELSTQWVDSSLEQLSQNADELARQALTDSASQDIVQLKESMAKLVERAECAAKLDLERRETAQKAIEDATATIASARQELALALGKEPGGLLRENGADPSDCVGQATSEIMAAKALLERGDTLGAKGALEAVLRLTNDGLTIVNVTKRAFADQEGTAATRRSETERITAMLPEHDESLACIAHQFVPAVLALGAGDPAHPNANGTIEDNMEEAREHLAAARELLGQSTTAFREARLLEAADLLRQIKERQETALFRLQEIADKQRRLSETEVANQKLLHRLETQLRECEPLFQDARTTMPTREGFDQACQLAARARASIESSQKDPFQAAQELEAANTSINQAVNRAQRDHELFAEAERSLQSAAAQLETARRLANDVASDNLGDSLEISQSSREIGALARALEHAQAELKHPRGEWSAVDAEADRIATEASRHAAILRRELKEAEAAVASLSTAASAVRAASGWTGSYGVVIGHYRGADYLAQARELLLRGSYAAARQAAETGCRVAHDAVAEAEAQVRRLRRAQEERLERERRRRREEEAARQRRQSSWSSSNMGGSRTSSFSSGSGVSRSSFSSGSGVSRSGW